MKRRDLLRHLEENGCEFLREGSSHTIYVNRRPEILSHPPASRNHRLNGTEDLQGSRRAETNMSEVSASDVLEIITREDDFGHEMRVGKGTANKFYPPEEFVGKSLLRLQSNKKSTSRSGETGIYERWAQAISSPVELRIAATSLAKRISRENGMDSAAWSNVFVEIAATVRVSAAYNRDPAKT